MPDRTWTRADWRILHRAYRVRWGAAWEVGLLTYPGPIHQWTGAKRDFAAWCLGHAGEERRAGRTDFARRLLVESAEARRAAVG